MVEIRRYIPIVEIQIDSPHVERDGSLSTESSTLQYDSDIIHDTEEKAWHSHDKIKGARVIGVVPIEFKWDNKGCTFLESGETKFLESE